MVERSESTQTSWQLLDAVRGIGIERGADLILRVLFVRWTTLATQSDSADWHELRAASPQGKIEFLRFTLGDLDDETADKSEAYRDAISRVVAIVDRMDIGEGGQGFWPRLIGTFDAVLDLLGEEADREAGEFQTPRSIADLMAKLTVRSGDTVHDPACGVGNALVAAHSAARDVQVTGNEINLRTAQRAQMRLLMRKITDVISVHDAFMVTEPGSADVVLVQPPWGVRSDSKRRWMLSEAPVVETTSRAGDMPWLFLALRTVRPMGRAAVVMTPNSLFPSHREAHAELLRRDAVEAIISLPGGLFRHTGIPTAIWLLRNTARPACRGKVLFIDAESMVEAADRKHVELPQGAIVRLTGLVEQYRDNGKVDAPTFQARVVETNDIDVTRGLSPQLHLAEPPPEATTHPVPERTLLTTVLLHNFKAFGRNARVDLAPLTLVYGANSAGKSSIIQALLLLKQSLTHDKMITQGPLANMGGFAGVVHRHNAAGVGLGFTYGALPSWLPSGGTADPSLMRGVRWFFDSQEPAPGALRTFRSDFGPHHLYFRAESDLLLADLSQATDIFSGLAAGSLLYPFETKTRNGDSPRQDTSRHRDPEKNARRALRALQSGDSMHLPLRRLGLMPSAETVLPPSLTVSPGSRDHSFALTYAGRLARLASGISAEVRQLLDSLVWLGPLRSAPRRVYDRSSTDPNPGDGRHTAMYLFDHVSVVDQVNEWMEQLEVPYSLEVLPLNAGGTSGLVGDLVALVLTDRRSGVQLTPADVGFGISQVLPIIVELLSRRESVIMIEQPETHLHPRLQSRLADLFIDTVAAGGRGNQIIVETHSEHIILRIQRRIREGTLDAGDVAVIYIDQDSKGAAVVHRLRLDADGNFMDEWPHGFFEERLGELFGEF